MGENLIIILFNFVISAFFSHGDKNKKTFSPWTNVGKQVVKLGYRETQVKLKVVLRILRMSQYWSELPGAPHSQVSVLLTILGIFTLFSILQCERI